MTRRAVVALRLKLEREFYRPMGIWPSRGKEIERLIEEAAEQIVIETKLRACRARNRMQLRAKFNARDVAILGGDPSL